MQLNIPCQEQSRESQVTQHCQWTLLSETTPAHVSYHKSISTHAYLCSYTACKSVHIETDVQYWLEGEADTH